jgi:predicted PhzF superfamily epimerase YddE/YHI9
VIGRESLHGHLTSRSRHLTTEWTVRFFFMPNGALLEDPATGPACANLGGLSLWRPTQSSYKAIVGLTQ